MAFTFFSEYVWVICALLILSLMGGFVIVPFRHSLKYPAFAAPFAGLLMLALSAGVFYGLFKLTLLLSASIAIILSSALSLFTFVYIRSEVSKPNLALIMMSLILVGIVTYVTDYSTISLGGPGFIFADGTDHLGYAQLGDWLSAHTINGQPAMSSTMPYEMWPATMFRMDPRFGSFYIMGILSLFHSHSGMFTYEIACTLVLAAAFISVAAIFARTTVTFFLLSFGLLLSSWFDYAHAGFFGKIFWYPGILYMVGLYLNAKRPLSMVSIACLGFISCALGAIYPGYAVALFFLFISLIFVILNLGKLKEKNGLIWLRDEVVIVALLSLITIATSGILSKPASPTNSPIQDLSWVQMIPRIIHIESFFTDLSHLTSPNLLQLSGLFLLILLCFIILACIKREYRALTLLSAPIILSVIFLSLKWETIAYQSIGFFYPLVLVGSIQLIDSLKDQNKLTKNIYILGMIGIILMISVHIPRFIRIVHHHQGSGIPSTQKYSIKDFDELQKLIGSSPVTIATSNVYQTLPLLVEFGRRNMAMQWTPEAWNSVVSYSGFPAPQLNSANHLWIIMIDKERPNKNCVVKYRTVQYQLLDCG